MFRTINCAFIAIIVAVSAGHAIMAQEQASERSLEGVWEVKTTPRNCVTGDPIPAAAFEGLYTFHKDGTMIASLRNTTSALERTAWHGLWRRELGWSDYSFKDVQIRRSVATGLFAGKQEIGGILTLSASGDEYTSDEYTIVYSVDGVPGTPFCINSVGTRFKLD